MFMWDGTRWVQVATIANPADQFSINTNGLLWRTQPAPVTPTPDPGPTEEEIAEAIASIKRALIARRDS
jgi:hypothetical protein